MASDRHGGGPGGSGGPGDGAPTASAILETRGLTVRYGGVRAVDGVDLRVPAAGCVGLIGPNGAGKTTTMDALSGFVPSHGEVTFVGRRIDALRPHQRARRGLARTFQSVELFDELTIRENVLVPAERVGWWRTTRELFAADGGARSDAVDEALALLDIGDLAAESPQSVSLGQRKLVTVARALAARPHLVLLDEPAAGLDSGESRALGRKLRQVAASGTSILLVDHDMGLVLGVCDYVYVLDFGMVIAQGTPDSVAADPRVIAAYLGEAPPDDTGEGSAGAGGGRAAGQPAGTAS